MIRKHIVNAIPMENKQKKKQGHEICDEELHQDGSRTWLQLPTHFFCILCGYEAHLPKPG